MGRYNLASLNSLAIIIKNSVKIEFAVVFDEIFQVNLIEG